MVQCPQITVIYHISRMNKNDMIMSIDTKNHLTNWVSFHDKKNSQQSGFKNIDLNIIKVIYEKPEGNIILNGEKQKIFSLRSGTRKGCPLPSLLFNIVLEVLATAIRHEKEIKDIQISKESV